MMRMQRGFRRMALAAAGTCTAVASVTACTSLLGGLPDGTLLGADGGATDGTIGVDATNPSDSAIDAASADDGASDGGSSDGDGGAVDKVVQISAGGASACAVTSAGALYCWGTNQNGAVGDGTTTTRSAAVRITKDVTGAELGPVAQVSAGMMHVCAALKDGAVYCWGDDSAGQLGDGMNLVDSGVSALQQHAPKKVAGVTAAFVESGFLHSCVPSMNGYTCWGSNGAGELGHKPGQSGDQPVTGFAGYANSVPQAGAQVPGSTQASLGMMFSCATTPPSDNVLCWGANASGQLGDLEAGTNSTPIPVRVGVIGLMAASKEVAASALYHACAIDKQGTLYCWGGAGAGELGPGVSVGNTLSYAVQVMSGVSHVSVAKFTTCITDATFHVQCWGGNEFGQLGHDPSMDPIPSCHDNGGPCNPTPTTLKVAGGGAFGPAVAISVGYNYVCALKDDATVWCWGQNSGGQLGNGQGGVDAGPSYAPVLVVGLP
jgi:alpha-tubulin suppressor-like RCC1 family protein